MNAQLAMPFYARLSGGTFVFGRAVFCSLDCVTPVTPFSFGGDKLNGSQALVERGQ